MESAIASNLRCPRSQPKRFADDYQPPYPAYTARSPASLERVVMGYYGVQWLPEQRRAADQAVATIGLQLAGSDGASTVERAQYVDEAGYETLLQIAYWTDPEAYRRFSETADIAAWWSSDDRETDGVGIFREIIQPSMSHLETLFSSADQLEGVGCVFGSRSEQDIQEHGYWGSMRDRLPAAQTDALAPSGELSASTGISPKRIRIAGHANIAVIRSGQDWSHTSGAELELYEGEMEPVLRAGMDYLRDSGKEIGCYSNRYLRHVNEEGKPVSRSFGYSYWRSLKHMEDWAEWHPTHEAIFGGFMNMVRALHGALDLQLYHEVVVVQPDEQFFEYIACHPRTGLAGMLECVLN